MVQITSEACAYGESLKQNGRIGNTVLYGDYFDARGNLAKMKGGIGARLSGFALQFFVGWVIPVVATLSAFYFGWEKTGWVFLALFAVSTAWWVFALALRFGLKVYWYATGKSDPSMKPVQIFQAMIDVWVTLEGPVVNPSMVREAMIKARDLGAVFDGAAWALVDRAISIDAAVMVTKTKAAG